MDSGLRVIPQGRATQSLFLSVRTYAVIALLFLFVQENGIFSTSSDTVATTEAPQSLTLSLLNAFVCLLTLSVVFSTLPTVIRALRSEPLLASFMFLATVSCSWSQVGLISLRHALFLDALIVFSVWFLTAYAVDQQYVLIFSTGVIVAVMSLTLSLGFPIYGRMATGEWKGVFWHKNQLSHAIELLFAPLFFHQFRSWKTRLIAWTMGALGAVLMIFSQARTGMLLALMLLCVSAFGRLVRASSLRIRPLMYYSAAIATVGVIPALLVARTFVLELLGKSSNLTGRLDTWPLLIPFIFKHPVLGYGMSGFWTGYAGDSGTAMTGMSGAMNTADNGYIDIALQFGVVGAVILSGLLFKSFVDFAVVSRRHLVPLSAFWYLGLVLDAVLANVSGSFFFSPYGITTITLVFGCVGLGRLRRNEA